MEITQIAFYIAVMFVVLALILLLAWIAKRYLGGGTSSGRTKGGTLRRRERRLSLVEAASISPRHKLVLVRRDNAEHLLLIGGATEVVVESRIMAEPPEADVDIRGREPAFERPSYENYGTPSSAPELSRSPGYPSTGFAAPPSGAYEPSLYRRGDDDVGFRDEEPGYGRTERDEEPDYFASIRGTDAPGERPSYLDRDEPEDRPDPPGFGRYRSPLEPEAEPNEPGIEERIPDEPAPDADEDTHQSRILNRFLRKDSSE